MTTNTAIERVITNAAGKANPGAAIDFAAIIAIINTIFQVLQNCPFGNAKKAIKAGDNAALVATYRAIKQSGYDGNAAVLAFNMVEEYKTATDDEIDQLLAEADALRHVSPF